MESTASLYQNNLKFHGVSWSQLFIFICWFIWKWRNKFIFDADFKGPYNASTIIFDYLLEWNNADLKPLSTASSKTEFLRWQKPPTGMFKLNVDGSGNAAGMIGAGGLKRDCDGNWCFGFSKNIGQGEVLQAEAFGLITGLQSAVDLHISHIMVETDSAVLVNLVQSSDLDMHPLGTVIASCNFLMNKFDSCPISHVYRERVDCLAKKSLDHELGICNLPTAPFYAVYMLFWII